MKERKCAGGRVAGGMGGVGRISAEVWEYLEEKGAVDGMGDG